MLGWQETWALPGRGRRGSFGDRFDGASPTGRWVRRASPSSCLVLRPRWTTRTITAPISDGEGTTRRGGRAHEARAVSDGGRCAVPEPSAHEAREDKPHDRAERRQQGLNLEREAILQPTVREAAGDLLRAHHLDHHRSVARQALDYDLPALRHGPPPSRRGCEEKARSLFCVRA